MFEKIYLQNFLYNQQKTIYNHFTVEFLEKDKNVNDFLLNSSLSDNALDYFITNFKSRNKSSSEQR